MTDRRLNITRRPMLCREVLPVLRRRLEVIAIFVGASAFSFWAAATW